MKRKEFKKDVLSILEEMSKNILLNGEVSDGIVKSKVGNLFAILAEVNASRVKRERVGMLNVLAKTIGANALIVSDKLGSEKLIEDIVYERHGTPVVSPDTLRKMLEGEKVFIRKLKSHFVVKVNPKKLKEARIRSGMSIGALANELGVSKKSVYDYETKGSRVSVEVAAKLVELYGEEILEPVDLSEFEGVIVDAEPHTAVEEKLLSVCNEAYHVPKGNVHVGGRIEREEFVAATPHGEKDDLEWFGELSIMLEKKSILIGFNDVPKELEKAPVNVVEDLEAFLKILKKGQEGWS